MKHLAAKLAAIVTALGELAAAPVPGAQAQLSPNCERNGRRDHCAITPIAPICQTLPGR